MKLIIPESILAIDPYVPGKPIEELEREFGIKDSIKMASNENPLGPSPRAMEAVSRALSKLHRYPDGGGHELIQKLSNKLGFSPDALVLGNGSDDLIGMLVTAFLRPGDEAVMPEPSFLMYDIAVKCSGAQSVAIPLNKDLGMDLEAMARAVTSKTRLVFICNPNNPTGTCVPSGKLEAFVKGMPDQVITVVDEAYIEFARDPQCASAVNLVAKGYPVVVMRTFSKLYGLAGLRVGYGVMLREVAEILNRVRHPFNVNSLAQAGALAALDDEDYVRKTLDLVHKGLDELFKDLKEMGVKTFPTQTNFFLLDVERNADEVYRELLKEGVIVRSMTSYGYPRYLRITVGLPEENERFLAAFKKVMG